MTSPILFQQNGDINSQVDGWTFMSKEGKEQTFNEFEGYYPNKGGRLEGPKFEAAERAFKFMRLTFEYSIEEEGYAGVFFFEADGTAKPDLYIHLAPTNGEFKTCDHVFYGRDNQATCQVFFQSITELKVRNVTVTPVTDEEAAQWCDEIYAMVPQLKYEAPQERLALIPKTIDALKNGTPWRIVMLGDSIINDTFNSNYIALIKRLYPQALVDVICSVRGSTGCWFYHEPDNFKEYVTTHKPDLLIVGGISNKRHEHTLDEAVNNIREVITMAQDEIGCETMLLTGPLGRAWEEIAPPETPSPHGSLVIPTDFWAALENLAKELKVEFQDQGTLWRNYLKSQDKHPYWFNRDHVHGNAFGEQVVARMLETYFQP